MTPPFPPPADRPSIRTLLAGYLSPQSLLVNGAPCCRGYGLVMVTSMVPDWLVTPEPTQARGLRVRTGPVDR